MWNKLAELGAWIAAAIAAIWWLRSDAKRDAKQRTQAEADRELLKRAEQANEVDKEIDAMPNADKRDRLRNNRK